jgi:RimJ/RimL family protein N-acetyltransferase
VTPYERIEATLRRPTAEDATLLAEWGTDPEFCEHAGWSGQTNLTDRRAWWSAVIAEPRADLIRLVVCLDDEVVGYVDLHGTDPHRRELGYVVGGRERWHRGIGTRAAIAGLSYGFTVLRLRTIWAEAVDANQASVAILRRAGMRETGRGADAEFLGVGSFYRQFEISASEFAARTG